MREFKDLICREANKISELNRAIHETYKNRTKNRTAWSKACSEFRNYHSEMQSFLSASYGKKNITCPELLEFIITFLELDPMFFRSGYYKEQMLKKLKKVDLDKEQILRLRKVMYSAVEERGSREYKGYCRLAPKLADSQLKQWLASILEKGKGSKRSRAELMLAQINRCTGT